MNLKKMIIGLIDKYVEFNDRDVLFMVEGKYYTLSDINLKESDIDSENDLILYLE